MGNINVNRQVFDAVQQAVNTRGSGERGRGISAEELQRIEQAIVADGDISRDESRLLSALQSQSRFELVSGQQTADIDPLGVSFPARSAFRSRETLQAAAVQRLGASAPRGETDASHDKLIADARTAFDGAAEALDAGNSERAAQILTRTAQTLRQGAARAGVPEKDILQELANNMDTRASAYRQTDPDHARGEAGSLMLYARNARMLADGLAQRHPAYSELMRQVSNDSRIQAELIDQTAANTKSMLGLAVSQTYRGIVDASFERRIAGAGTLNNLITHARDRLEADRLKMREVFNYVDGLMQREGLSFHEAWHTMFDDNRIADRRQLRSFATAHDAAAFLRDHEVSRGLLMPMADLSEGLATGNDAKVDQARGRLVESLRENDQWSLAGQVLEDYRANARTRQGQSQADRLHGNASSEWWKAKASQFAREELPILLLSGVLSGGVGLGARALASTAGWSARAARVAQISTEIATFVPTERVLSDVINGRRADWSPGAMARDYALTLGGYGLAKALGAGWRALRGQGALTQAASHAPLRPGPGIQTADPNRVRFSQNTVSYNKVDRATGERINYDDIVASMRRDGWKGDPVDVVQMGDGAITSIDNTRILAAREAGISVRVRVRSMNEPLTAAEKTRFTKDGFPTPNTWGEAIQVRIRSQRGRHSGGTFAETFPEGSLYPPRITGRPRGGN